MAINPFLPKVPPTVAEDRYRKFSRAGRMAIGSQYVIHLAENGSQQVMFMKFHDVPDEVDMGLELGVASSAPMLFGMIEEFVEAPKIYRKGEDHRGAESVGSRFVVHGYVYQAKKVDTHHLGGVVIEVSKDSACDVREMQFFDHVRPYLCLPERS